MRKLSPFLLKVFAFSVGFFLLWLVIGEYALSALAKIVLVPLTVSGYRPTGTEVVGKSIYFTSAVPGQNRRCDVELAPMGFIVFLSLALAFGPMSPSRRLKATGLGFLIMLAFHILYLSLRVLLFSSAGFASSTTYLLRFFVPAAILFPVILWVLLFPVDIFRFARTAPQLRLKVDKCPICGSERADVATHMREAHGTGKKGLKSRAARRYFEAFGEEKKG
ncbi:MAG: hypothetical protein AMJ46_11180 [Latescibacteria bacterium DG_63]|nr:MAG: hypothetical protein AMJ46_11180 [Latescibacteria bacterium DG_63]